MGEGFFMSDDRDQMRRVLAAAFDTAATRSATSHHAALMIEKSLADAGFAIVEVPDTFQRIADPTKAVMSKLRSRMREARHG
jgi:phage terminase large subunit-like protein